MFKKFIFVSLLFAVVLGVTRMPVYADELATWSLPTRGTLTNNDLSLESMEMTNVIATQSKTAGKWYWEIKLDSINDSMGMAPFMSVGISEGTDNIYSTKNRYNFMGLLEGTENGQFMTFVSGLPSPTTGDIIGVAMDLDKKVVHYYKNGDLIVSSMNSFSVSNEGVYPFFRSESSHYSKITANFGATPFAYPIPEGFAPYSGTQTSSLSILLAIGETIALSVNDEKNFNSTLTWSSSDNEVITVSSDGQLNAIKAGFAKISVENNDGSYKESIYVKVLSYEIINEFRLAADLNVDDYIRLYLNDDIQNITWRSMDTSVATVSSNGKVTGISNGLAIITADYDGITKEIYVRVN